MSLPVTAAAASASKTTAPSSAAASESAAAAAESAAATRVTAAANIDADASALPLLVVRLGDGVIGIVARGEGNEAKATRAS